MAPKCLNYFRAPPKLLLGIIGACRNVEYGFGSGFTRSLADGGQRCRPHDYQLRGELCGRIIWLESATDRSGSLRLDQNNPDPAKQTQRICGLVVISGFKPSGPDTWNASVYNPQDGQTYSGNITVLSEKALKVRAYIGLPIFGRSQTWTRVNSPGQNDIEYKCRSDR
jgi:hypothetical protein